jgi:hypothetical protein
VSLYLLLDANVTAGYYLPRCLDSKRAQDRVATIFDSVRSKNSDHFLYIPNFCIAEVFGVFAKHSFGGWNSQVRKKGTIDTRVYRSLKKQFARDIHNGHFLYQYELSRYHILGIDLIAPVDHYFQVTRGKKRHVPMGTFDQLIISMGIQLAHIHGSDNVVVLTADSRLTNILDKCRAGLNLETIKKLKLDVAREVTGREFSSAIFPKCLNLKTATKADLEATFDLWPLPTGGVTGVYRWLK